MRMPYLDLAHDVASSCLERMRIIIFSWSSSHGAGENQAGLLIQCLYWFLPGSCWIQAFHRADAATLYEDEATFTRCDYDPQFTSGWLLVMWVVWTQIILADCAKGSLRRHLRRLLELMGGSRL